MMDRKYGITSLSRVKELNHSETSCGENNGGDETLPCNYPPLTPISFIERAAIVFGDSTSVVYNNTRFTWSQTFQRCRRLASALSSRNISRGDVISIVAPNIPAMPGTIYLWTLPMFHSKGWCFPWALAAIGGINICLRKFNAKIIFDSIADHNVTHLCGAPVMLSMMANAAPFETRPLPGRVDIITSGAPPPPSILFKMEELGFSITHWCGFTETSGTVISCVWKPEWDSLQGNERARLKARQGIRSLSAVQVDVKDPVTMTSVARDGVQMGEIMIRAASVMKGYLKNEEATDQAFAGGWFRTGDVAVVHPDGYLEIKDRSKDVIISGGENISSVEVESVLYSHPLIAEAAVVGMPDPFWGETPCAFVSVKSSDHGDGHGQG
ncbi:hypothetical protein SUGI_0595780 [Cryptomeria japonica]|nr:hypothetical protein SUGI_0595780 [Cryptomeria japonica]